MDDTNTDWGLGRRMSYIHLVNTIIPNVTVKLETILVLSSEKLCIRCLTYFRDDFVTLIVYGVSDNMSNLSTKKGTYK